MGFSFMSKHGRAIGFPPVAAALLAVACAGTATRPTVIAFPSIEARPAPHIQGIVSYDIALATIGAVFERDFGFPPIQATVYLLGSRAALEHELLAAGYDAPFARDAAARMRAIALHRRVLVNEAELSASSWPARIGTLAHELVHCLQYELAGGRRGTSDQWLREGFAEWVSLDVLQRLGAFSTAASRRYLRDELAASRRSQAPRLEDMLTFRQWVDLAGRRDIAPHVQAVLAVDLLIERHGVPAILGYFERFAAREDPEGHFFATFGQSRDDFERDVDVRLGLSRR